MLVLSRKLDESILLPDLGITITVVAVGDNRVRIGIEAPREITIQRAELASPPRKKKCSLSDRPTQPIPATATT